MRESNFQREIKKSIELISGCHYVKIPDSGPGLTYGSVGSRFAVPKPYDCYFLKDSKFYALELKMMRSLTGFPFDRVTEFQEENLYEVDSNGGKGFILINYRPQDIPEKTMKKYNLEQNRLNITYALPIYIFKELRQIIYLGRRSIPFQYFWERGLKLEWQRFKDSYVWNLRKLFY